MTTTRVEHIMGTAISIKVRDDTTSPVVIDGVFEHLRAADRRFSTYRPESVISRVARGELAEADCDPEVRHVLAVCDHLAVASDGAFDARHQHAPGGLDPSAYVKGWAVEEAA